METKKLSRIVIDSNGHWWKNGVLYALFDDTEQDRVKRNLTHLAARAAERKIKREIDLKFSSEKERRNNTIAGVIMLSIAVIVLIIQLIK